MIAFSRELLEEDERPSPVLIVAPRMIVKQAELAMLQRALVRCGLFENATGSIKG